MYSHMMVGTNDMAASKAFYDALLGSLGYEPAIFFYLDTYRWSAGYRG